MAAEVPDLERRKSAIGLSLTLFMVSFHIGVVPAIMPPLVRNLDSNVGYIQGALVLLSLVTAAFAPTSENLSRRFGRQTIFQGGLALFAIGTVLAAMSPTISLFVVSYALITGVAATPLVSIPWALVDNLYDQKTAKIASLLLTLSMVSGGLVGSLIGGLIAFQYSWRLAFPIELILIPLIVSLVKKYPSTMDSELAPIDWVGGCLSLLGLGLTLLGVSLSGEFGWWEAKKTVSLLGISLVPFGISVTPVLIASGLVFLGILQFWRRRQAREHRVSVIKIGLLNRHNFVMSLAIAMLHTALFTGLSFNLYQFVPPVLSTNSFQTALIILPYNFAMIIVLICLVRFINVQLLPRRILQLGLIFEIAGLIMLIRSIALGMGWIDILPALVVIGVGSGLFTSQIGAIAYSATNRQEKPEATGIFNPLQKVGQALGRAILGTALISLASLKIVDGVTENLGRTISLDARRTYIVGLQRAIQTFTDAEMKDLFARLPDTVQPSLERIIDTAAIEAMQMTVFIILGVNVLCLLLTIKLPQYRLKRR